MSVGPISVADPGNTPPGAPAEPGIAAWHAEDTEWEIKQESAAACCAANDRDGAARLWGEALFLAREHFEPHDARLATSVANHAVGLCWSGRGAAAGVLFDEAMSIWEASGAWVERLKPEQRARSSLYHLRMEGRHRPTYDKLARDRLVAAWEDGRKALAALARGEATGHVPVERWRREKPPTLSDPRKLIAAVCLIAPDRG